MYKKYLGDAVYVELDIRRASLKLTIEEGGSAPLQAIYLDAEVCAALVAYITDPVTAPQP